MGSLNRYRRMALVKKYPVEVVSVTSQVDGVYTVSFASDGTPFKYHPGQFLHLAMDEYDPSSQWPDSRCFSIQSSPGNELIKITYAVKGRFTTRMQKELKPGKPLTIKLPYGDLFTRVHNKTNTVFIAGGTGITPFLSLFNYRGFQEYTNPVLFAGFRSHAHNFYIGDLDKASGINPGLRILTTYQDEEGPLNIARIVNEIDISSTFFISGPPSMIRSFRDALMAAKINENQIQTDDWE
jgi:ferredoxin-NADP reductase